MSLLIVVPTRGRPGNIRRMVQAWRTTNATADLMLSYDSDDPQGPEYAEVAKTAGLLTYVNSGSTPMVPAIHNAIRPIVGRYQAVGTFGDDHVPRTPGWDEKVLRALAEPGIEIVYGDDLHRGEDLPTQWVMTSRLVWALGRRLVPAPVDHQFSDRSVLDLGRAAGCIRYLPDVVIEHMHYAAGKAKKDAGYQRVNAKAKYLRDQRAYQRWKDQDLPRIARQIKP